MSDRKSAFHNNVTALTLGAIGVVYGDIGTSPLYASLSGQNHVGEVGHRARWVLAAFVRKLQPAC
ncbi:KUP/HAK/KT family potassium transporter [Sphingobium subterraneum]|uniref:K+ transporter n=1 Tax=Sphingobium subterraneum TaxID=627688 RepID=A0A841J673_9SPHN|nr:KUP/HAK/KT family potassium transporter [Sphingobium subterraneum]MBB6124035.1 K+ transporter [Sphingobium subterraneum]